MYKEQSAIKFKIVALGIILTLLFSSVIPVFATKGFENRISNDTKNFSKTVNVSNGKTNNSVNVNNIDNSSSTKIPEANTNKIQQGITASAITVEAITVDAIIVYKNKLDTTRIKEKEGKINRTYKNLPAAKINIPINKLEELSTDPNILSVEIDQIVEITADTIDWGTERIQAPISWSVGYTGAETKVAVIDTGIASHSDLAVAGGASFTNYTSSYLDDNGHGTHVAGIIAARQNNSGTVGVAPNAKLYSVKALGSDGSGYLSDVISGIDWAIANNMDIINLSIGMQTDSFALHQIIDTAYTKGILIVAAAGNNGTASGTEDNVSYPARYSSVIAVGATDSNNIRATFSSTGTTVEVAAPGKSVLSTYLNGQYVQMSGTSMAAPYVTGQLALLKEAYPEKSASEIRKILQEKIKDIGETGKDSWYGYGLIQTFVNADTQPTYEESEETESNLRNTWKTEKIEKMKGKSEIVSNKGIILAQYNLLRVAGEMTGAAELLKDIMELDIRLAGLQTEITQLVDERIRIAKALYTEQQKEQYYNTASLIRSQYRDVKILEIGSVALNNNIIKLDSPAYIKGGRTIVPVRAITEALGATVNYDFRLNLVTITKDQIDIVLAINSSTVLVNGVEQHIDSMAEITCGRTYVPLRFIAETFGLSINYDQEADMIDID